jgi:predicted O-methyltransferase YrrM
MLYLVIKIFHLAGDYLANIPLKYIPHKFSERIFLNQFSKVSSNLEIIKKISIRMFQFDTQFIPGMLRKSEAEALLYLSALSEAEGDVIEIGSWMGKSTVHLAKGLSIRGQGKVYAIDTFKGNPGKEKIYRAPLREGETIYSRFLKNIEKAGFKDIVVPFKMTSKEARKKFKNIQARLLFIDACHDYDAVREDILLWKDTLTKGGLIVLHDFSGATSGCAKAIYEEVITNNEFKPLFLVDSLLVAQKN